MATAAVDLTPPALDLLGIRAGDTNAIGVYLHHGPDPKDLTGITVTAQARKNPIDAEAAISAQVEVDADPTSGNIVLSWDGDEVRTMLAGAASWTGVWDLQLANGTVVQTAAAGKFSAAMDVTR